MTTGSARKLTALRVGNFKAFADTQRIPIKPITLIFGPNSAGKSSFIHSLALAHEARFGRDKRNLARLDVHHTDLGGSAIDLGGFRQYVHRGEARRRVEWGAELNVAAFDGRLGQLLAPVETITLTVAIGIELDDQDRPRPGAEPRVESVEIAGDGIELLRMSRRGNDKQGGILRLDRLASDHAVLRQVLKAIVESATTSEEMRPEDFDGANEAIAELLPELQVRIEQFFPSAVQLPRTESGDMTPASLLFPVSKGNRKEDIAQAVRFYLPRTLNELIKGLADMLADELKRLQYLGPLRSFPSRHLAFAEHEDANWYAGGGYAWDVVRRDDSVRETVNRWLGSDRLKTPYELVVRSLVAIDQIKEPLEYIDDLVDVISLYRVETSGDEDLRELIELKDIVAQNVTNSLESAEIPKTIKLVLVDQRTKTTVTHRDVGIGISQVLPVLVMAYGSQNKILAMEQPEIHLHPALQAELGDVFIESALGESKNTFILETHSEHLMLRLLRRVRETTENELPEGLIPVRPEDVGVLYVQPDHHGVHVIDIPVTADGDFATAWPEGFFAERAEELFG